MKRLVCLLIAAALSPAAFGQPTPTTKGPLMVQVATINPATLSKFLPIVPSDLNFLIVQVFVSSSNPETARFRVTISVHNGDTVTTETQEVARNLIMMSMAQFRVPLTAKLIGAVVVTEIGAPVSFDLN
jgi:hypothetical protein